MPAAAPRPCRAPACGALVSDGSGYCAKHQPLKTKWADDKQRGNRHQRGYGSAWNKLRLKILDRDNHLCQECLRGNRYVPGNHVDHKVPKFKGGTDDESNLQTLCVKCHKEKTAREK
jgi:5-methylcytosine-specific restriction enzyme A